jgi:protein involved in polysaccharide export with SLBB domain
VSDTVTRTKEARLLGLGSSLLAVRAGSKRGLSRMKINSRSNRKCWGLVLLFGVAGFLSSGCSTSPAPGQVADPPDQIVAPRISPQNVNERLAQLTAERNREAFTEKFSIGPGDLLELSVPDAPELNNQTVRVTPEGAISLPLTGTLTVAGLNEEEVTADLRDRIGKYIKDPQIKVFVKQSYSHQVAVIGMVQKPGVYTLQSRSETILEVLSRAGGLTENASRQVLFVPSEATGLKAKTLQELVANSAPQGANPLGDAGATSDKRYDQASSPEKPDQVVPAKLDTHPGGGDSLGAASLLQESNPISINLAEVVSLDVPLRPGDVIIVPAMGEVMVGGWVPNPGAFKITTGMTALAAIGAAGGPMFSSSAEVLRAGPEGTKTKIPIDLSRVQNGEEPDVPVQSGDVVLVNRSLVGSVPYGIYTLFTKFGTGMYVVP